MNLASLDLNLLVLLDALLEEKHVTRAGARVGLSQPAASNALKRLRLILKDPILEKDGRHMRLSERGHQFKEPLRKVLDELRRVLRNPGPFDSSNAEFTVRLFASDHIAFVLLPALMRRLNAIAPGVDVVVHWADNHRVVELLETGAIDVAIGRYHDTPSNIRRALLYEEEQVVQAREGHPIFDEELTLERFSRYARIATSFDGRNFGDQERAVARAGADVRGHLVLPHLVAAPMLTLDTDLVTIAPRRMAQRLKTLMGLDWRPVPFASPPVPIEMMWHETAAQDVAQSWLRQQIAAVGATI